MMIALRAMLMSKSSLFDTNLVGFECVRGYGKDSTVQC
jgi:hypothetical protein